MPPEDSPPQTSYSYLGQTTIWNHTPTEKELTWAWGRQSVTTLKEKADLREVDSSRNKASSQMHCSLTHWETLLSLNFTKYLKVLIKLKHYKDMGIIRE